MEAPMDNEKFYYAIPVGVLREFMKQNADVPNDAVQLFELNPEHIFSESELKESGGLERRGITIINP